LPLPLGGLMALDSAAVVAKRVEAIEAGLKAAGCPYDSVEMTISLLGLIVIEELHLSNVRGSHRGGVDRLACASVPDLGVRPMDGQ